MDVDVVVRGGTVVDGDGGPARRADVAIVGDRIAAVGALDGDVRARTVLDAAGAVVAPGFIDVHTHSDVGALLAPGDAELAAASLRQGVTTEVAGNCGFSPFPVGTVHRAAVEEHVEPLFGAVELAWDDLAGYRDAVCERGLYASLAPLVGHGSLRAAVMGFADRPATGEELRAMERLLEVAIDQGAAGLSSGLVYVPGIYAPTEELIALARVVARHGLPYTSHLRSETDGLEAAVEEAIEIGTASGARVQLSHHKAAGRANWGRVEATLARVDAARAAGVDVGLDVYPYTAGATLLHSLLPPWAQQGGTEPMLERLADVRLRARAVADMRAGLPGWHNIGAAAGWERVVVSFCPGDPTLEGASLGDLAQSAGGDACTCACMLVLEHEARVQVILELMSERDVRRVLRHPCAAIGSDGIPLPGKPHPRWAGSFARVLGRYVREEGVLELSDAIRRMTALPAEQFNLRDRGRLAAGLRADVVVFDPEAVADRATFEQPLEPPIGVRHVVVGGAAAVSDGALTGVRAGDVATAARE